MKRRTVGIAGRLYSPLAIAGADFWPLDLSSTASSRSPAFQRWTWGAGPARPAQESESTRDGLNLLLQL
jgi:hypothetical protein